MSRREGGARTRAQLTCRAGAVGAVWVTTSADLRQEAENDFKDIGAASVLVGELGGWHATVPPAHTLTPLRSVVCVGVRCGT